MNEENLGWVNKWKQEIERVFEKESENENYSEPI